MEVSAIRGVNLGGWLVLERWIAPIVFHGTDATDEYSLCAQLGPIQAAGRLTKHRDSFITEQTIKQVAALGLNTVRLPVGHWLFGGIGPYVDGASRYVERLFIWAEKYGVNVILDIHAVPGSQNGWDHSGRAGELGWHRGQDNILATLQFVAYLCEKYGDDPRLVAIEVLNEPHWDVPMGVLLDYYRRAYQIVRTKCPGRVGVIFSDAFRPDEMSRALAKLDMQNVALDMHMYQLFTDDDKKLDLNGHMRKSEKAWPKIIRDAASYLPVIVGEWCAAMDQSHYTFAWDDYRKYSRKQIETFESQSAGWVYWTALTQDGGAWSLLDHPELLAN